jgi:rsbT co-antagonist protein RsbR
VGWKVDQMTSDGADNEVQQSDDAQDDHDGMLSELVAHLRDNREHLREQWTGRITDARLLSAMTPDEIFSEATSIYDNYVEVLETGSTDALQHYARDLSERIIPRGVETDEVVNIVLLLRDVLARSLFEKYHADFDLLNRVLDAYEPAANRIANMVAVSFVQERERVIRDQQEAIRELSTPVLQVRERLLILPIIGILDDARARQLTEQLLKGIRAHRAKVVVIDITGVPDVDEGVANSLVQTVDASKLMGASVIITGCPRKSRRLWSPSGWTSARWTPWATCRRGSRKRNACSDTPRSGSTMSGADPPSGSRCAYPSWRSAATSSRPSTRRSTTGISSASSAT